LDSGLLSWTNFYVEFARKCVRLLFTSTQSTLIVHGVNKQVFTAVVHAREQCFCLIELTKFKAIDLWIVELFNQRLFHQSSGTSNIMLY